MKPLRRAYGTYSTTVDVNIDVSEVVAELTDGELKAECTLRNIATEGGSVKHAEDWRDFADEMRSARNDRLHFEVLVLRMLVMAGVPSLKIGVMAKAAGDLPATQTSFKSN